MPCTHCLTHHPPPPPSTPPPPHLSCCPGIMSIEHVDFDGTERLALVLGGDIVSTFDDPGTVKLGHCKVIEEIMIGEDKLIHFGGEGVAGRGASGRGWGLQETACQMFLSHVSCCCLYLTAQLSHTGSPSRWCTIRQATQRVTPPSDTAEAQSSSRCSAPYERLPPPCCACCGSHVAVSPTTTLPQ